MSSIDYYNTDPGEGYRLLDDGEMMQDGDEFSEDDGITWESLNGQRKFKVFTWMHYPIRRKVMKNRKIFDFSCEEQRTMLLDICNRIYIARNISLSNEDVSEQLKKIDTLFRDGGTSDESGN